MSQQKKSNFNSSSLIDLKAELLRKQQQFQKEKSDNTGYAKAKLKEKKSDLWSRSNAGVRERAQRDMEEKQEEEDALSKSRKKLQAKAKLYEAMTSSKTIPEEDGSKRFLVDFERKTIDKLIDEKRAKESRNQEIDSHQREREKEEKEEKEDVQKLFLNEKVPDAENPDEEWVDFTDSLGRSRRCMKKDLPDLVEMDKNLSKTKNIQSLGDTKNTAATSIDDNRSTEGTPDLMSADMYREKLRAQWEKEEREAMEGPAGPMHYSNVQYDEIRTHGVGFYQFDKKDAMREEQMQELLKMREQTKDKRAAHKELKNKRKAMLASRLAKVRQRKLIREGKDPMEMLDLDKSDESDDDIIGPRMEEKEPEPEPLIRDESWRKTAPIRDWDKGKEGLDEFREGRQLHSEESWKEKLRQERLEDFAPPSIYQDKTSVGVRSKQFPNKSSPFTAKKSEPKDPVAAVGATKFAPKATLDVISETLSAIRSEVENKKPSGRIMTENKEISHNRGVSNMAEDLANIPLPPSSGTGEPSVPSDQTQYTPEQYQNSTYQSQINLNQGVFEQGPYGNNLIMPSAPNPYACYEENMLCGAFPPNIVAPQANITGGTFGVQESFHQVSKGISPEMLPTEASLSSEISATATAASVPGTADIMETPAQETPVQEIPAKETPAQETPVQATPVQETPAEESGPQPAHYASGPMKPQPKKARYERVNLHELPMTLPVPPTASNMPLYPSQEDVLGFQKQKQEAMSKKPMTEEQAMKHWKKQFHYKDQKPGDFKPSHIPFASPYIQNTEEPSTEDPAVEFDPSKPPPSK